MSAGVMPLRLVVLLLRLMMSRCCHSVAAIVLVADGQIAHARDKSFYQFRAPVVLWVVPKLAE